LISLFPELRLIGDQLMQNLDWFMSHPFQYFKKLFR